MHDVSHIPSETHAKGHCGAQYAVGTGVGAVGIGVGIVGTGVGGVGIGVVGAGAPQLRGVGSWTAATFSWQNCFLVFFSKNLLIELRTDKKLKNKVFK